MIVLLVGRERERRRGHQRGHFSFYIFYACDTAAAEPVSTQHEWSMEKTIYIIRYAWRFRFLHILLYVFPLSLTKFFFFKSREEVDWYGMNRKTESIRASKLKKQNKVFQGVDNDPVIRRRHWKPSSRSFFFSPFLYTPLFKRNKINKYKIYIFKMLSQTRRQFLPSLLKRYTERKGENG